jgi:hypothetical protein
MPPLIFSDQLVPFPETAIPLMWHEALLDLFMEKILPTISNFVSIREDIDGKITLPVSPQSTLISQPEIRKNMLRDFIPLQVSIALYLNLS